MFRFAAAVALLFACTAPQGLAAPKARTPVRHRTTAKKKPAAVTFDPAVVNNPATVDEVGPKSAGSATLRAAILLDRANFSSGEISGSYDDRLKNAISYFQQAHGLPVDGVVHKETWDALNADTAQALETYTIAADDLKGPFEKLPEGMAERAKLTALGYESPLEEFGERFHSSPALLTKLNHDKQFDKEGEQLLVPNVNTPPPPKASLVVVNGSDHTVTALDAEGKVIAEYPASVGSEHDPLPVGDWKINGRSYNPKFHYNPNLFWDAKEDDKKATLPPGPNNPVGLVWIDLSKEHYGIHGTPEPANIGKTQSHGCIRLTNWDAVELAGMVTPGMRAVLKME